MVDFTRRMSEWAEVEGKFDVEEGSLKESSVFDKGSCVAFVTVHGSFSF